MSDYDLTASEIVALFIGKNEQLSPQIISEHHQFDQSSSLGSLQQLEARAKLLNVHQGLKAKRRRDKK